MGNEKRRESITVICTGKESDREGNRGRSKTEVRGRGKVTRDVGRNVGMAEQGTAGTVERVLK